MVKRHWIALFSFMVLSGCDVAGSGEGPNKSFEYREFGERCMQHEECRSTYCLTYAQGSFCTKECSDGCPDGWSCVPMDNPHGEGRVSLCTRVEQPLCMPCVDNSACGQNNSNWCMTFSNGRYCSQDCTYQGCPEGYTCEDRESETGTRGRQCIPISGGCACDEKSVGLVRGCVNTNAFGTCYGQETCGGDGLWSSCDAKTPSEEVCNGIDDDCDGFIDEELDGNVCDITNEFGTCKGVELCAGAEGKRCYGQTPSEEICNGIDDDCDGETDEDFVNEDGVYYTKMHCGGCGQNCDDLMVHATKTACMVSENRAQCRALECEEGYFVYMDGAVCLALPDNLCTVCSQDSDCIGPNSLCVDTGTEAYCGRDCSDASPYGACPSGYTCQTVRDGQRQCVPISGTCLCNRENEGSARSCKRDTCEGFERCIQDKGMYVWSSCETEPYNIEVCDGLDNNCDGVIDEGMRDPVTGLYTSREHCGYCFNDCTKYYQPEIHHVEGVCIVSSGAATCGMGSCATETIDGVDYEWVNTDGDESNGCECRRNKGNLRTDLPEIPETYASGYDFIDENCDGIDGVIEDAIFVSQSAPENGDGTLLSPYRRVGDALKAWSRSGKKYILVSEGLYEEDLSLPNGVVLHGGYSVNFRERDLVLHASILRGVSAQATVQAIRLTEKATVSGFVIEGATRTESGKSSVAVWIQNTTQVALYANKIVGGQGGHGKSGDGGAPGHGSKEDSALNGGTGMNSERYPGPCVDRVHAGGKAGVNSSCQASNATSGGQTVCPSYNWATHMGGRAAYAESTLNRGLGGFDSSFDAQSTSGCSHATESGFPTLILSDVGENGKTGANGGDGSAGVGAKNPYGTIIGGAWQSADSAGSGGAGRHGVAGGGGGGGGGVAYYNNSSSDCPLYEIGPSGGGGGAGGCGGQGGQGGESGGGSIGLFISASRLETALPTVRGNLFVRGRGGDGGAGGVGGAGGAGGVGGQGGIAGYWISMRAGSGGAGGAGGRGGGGGGGAGGPSFDILGFNVTSSSLVDSNTFTYDDSVARGGFGGLGGLGGADASGQDGVHGASRRQLDLRSCAAGSKCANATTCNKDNVCLPNK